MLALLRLLHSCKGINLSLLKNAQTSICVWVFFVVVSSQTPEASSSRAGDLCSLSHNWIAGAESFQERSNAISLLDIDNSLGDGCQHVNGLALQLSASQVVFCASWRLQVTHNTWAVPSAGPLPRAQPSGDSQHQAVSPHWAIFSGSLPPPLCHPPALTGKWAELRLPSSGQAPPVHHEAPILAVPQQHCPPYGREEPVLNSSPHMSGAGLAPAVCPVRGMQLSQELPGSSLQSQLP